MYRIVLLMLIGCINDGDEHYNMLVPWDLGPDRAQEGDARVLPEGDAPDSGPDDTCEPAECGGGGGVFLDGPWAGEACFCQAPCEAFGTCCRNTCEVCPDECPELPGLSVEYLTGGVIARTIALWMILVTADIEVVEECTAKNSDFVRCEPTSAVESGTEVLLVARFVQPNGRVRSSCADGELVGRYVVFWRLIELKATGTVHCGAARRCYRLRPPLRDPLTDHAQVLPPRERTFFFCNENFDTSHHCIDNSSNYDKLSFSVGAREENPMGQITATFDPETRHEAQLKQLVTLACDGEAGLVARIGAVLQLGLEKRPYLLAEVAAGTNSPPVGALAVNLLAQDVADDWVFVGIASEALSAEVAVAALSRIASETDLIKVTRRSGSQIVGGAVVGMLVKRKARPTTLRAVAAQAALPEVCRMAAGVNRGRNKRPR